MKSQVASAMELRRRSKTLGLNAAISTRLAQAGLLEECADQTIIDKDEHPQTAEIDSRGRWHRRPAAAAAGDPSPRSPAGVCRGHRPGGERLGWVPSLRQVQGAGLRFVVRAVFNRDMADALLHDIERAVHWLHH